MSIEDRIDRLIASAQSAIEDTYKWERKGKITQRINYGILAFDIIWLGILLTVWPHTTWFSIVVMVGVIALITFLIHKQKQHLEWIQEVREEWQSKALHWQAAKIEYTEQGYIGDWAFKYDA